MVMNEFIKEDVRSIICFGWIVYLFQVIGELEKLVME